MDRVERQTIGADQRLDISLVQSIASIMHPDLIDEYVLGLWPGQADITACVYSTADGFVVSTHSLDGQFARIWDVIGLPEQDISRCVGLFCYGVRT